MLARTAWIASLLLLFSGCSLTLDLDDECANDLGCPLGSRCVAGFCEPKEIIEPDSPCDRIYGVDPRTTLDPVITIGVLLPRTGALGTLGTLMDHATELAVDDINTNLGGLLGRKLAIVSCDSKTSIEGALEGVEHLVHASKVNAIVGAGASSLTIEAFNRHAGPNGVLMVSPSATSPAITTLPDEGLLWRTAPSDAVQGKAIAGYLADPDQGYTRIAVVHRDDAYGNGLASAIQADYCMRQSCDLANFVTYLYVDDPDDPNQVVQQQAIVDAIKADPPDVVVLIGFVTDGASFLNLAAGLSLPFVLSDGMRDAALATAVTDDALLCGIVGTNPASPVGVRFDTFKTRFNARFSSLPGTFSANSFDAVFVIGLAYAGAAGAGILEPRGRDLATALTRMADPDAIEVALGDGWGTGVTTLATDGTSRINVAGVSGPLDFDSATGEAISAIELWRFDSDLGAIQTLGVVLDDLGVYKKGIVSPRSAGQRCGQ